MKTAVLSDIHGNIFALEKVLQEAERCEVEHLFILGDLVGYYYHPDKVWQLLEPWSKDIIKGNHEEMLADARLNKEKANSIRTKYGHGIDIALQKLSSAAINILINLPETKQVFLDGLSFFLSHGSPWDVQKYIYSDSAPELLDKCIVPGFNFILMGHTHYSFFYCSKNTTIINPGSVGQSRDKGGVASWVLVDTNNRAISFKSTYYDVALLIKEAKNIDSQLPCLWNVLERNNPFQKLFIRGIKNDLLI